MANYVNYPIENISRLPFKSYTELFRKAKANQLIDKNGDISFYHQFFYINSKDCVDSRVMRLVYTKDFLLEKIAEESESLSAKEITTLIHALRLSSNHFEIQDVMPLEEKLHKMRDKLI